MSKKSSSQTPKTKEHHLIQNALNAQKVETGPKKLLWLTGIFLLQLGILWLDFRTGIYLNGFALYIIPIGLATWKIGIGPGITCCFIAAFFGLCADYLVKPESSHVLLLTTALTRVCALSLLTCMAWKIKKMNQSLTQVILKDTLTGISNRNAFFLAGELELERMARASQPLSFVFLDLDNFKLINDSKGHHTGDELLRHVAHYIQSRLRKIDVFARLGGDEFALILPFTDSAGATNLMKGLHADMNNEFAKKNSPVGFSIGIATFEQAPESLNYALKCADNVMYEVKKTTKNSVLQRDFSPLDETNAELLHEQIKK